MDKKKEHYSVNASQEYLIRYVGSPYVFSISPGGEHYKPDTMCREVNNVCYNNWSVLSDFCPRIKPVQ